MRTARTAGCVLFSVVLAARPALAQQPPDQPIKASALAAAQQAGTAPTQIARRPLFLTGVAIGLAGGAAIILGTTVARTSSSTSGNTPESGFASCESLKTNPVYRGNECDVLKGPNKALVVGGAIAAATGVTLALIGSANSSVTAGPGIVGFRHRLTF